MLRSLHFYSHDLLFASIRANMMHALFFFFFNIFLMRLFAWCCRAGYVQMKQAAACAL